MGCRRFFWSWAHHGERLDSEPLFARSRVVLDVVGAEIPLGQPNGTFMGNAGPLTLSSEHSAYGTGITRWTTQTARWHRADQLDCCSGSSSLDRRPRQRRLGGGPQLQRRGTARAHAGKSRLSTWHHRRPRRAGQLCDPDPADAWFLAASGRWRARRALLLERRCEHERSRRIHPGQLQSRGEGCPAHSARAGPGGDLWRRADGPFAARILFASSYGLHMTSTGRRRSPRVPASVSISDVIRNCDERSE